MRMWNLIALTAIVAVGCGKKKEPETAAAPSISTTVGVIDINRKSVPDGQDQRWINVPLTVTNSLAGDIKVTKIEWAIGVGGQDLGANSKGFDTAIKGGESAEFKLSNEFKWKDETNLAADKGNVAGTIYWTGPKGNEQTTPFVVLGDIKAEPAAGTAQ